MYFDFLNTYFNSPDYEIIQILREYAISISDISLIDFLISAARISCGYLIGHQTEGFEDYQNRTEVFCRKKTCNYMQKNILMWNLTNMKFKISRFN